MEGKSAEVFQREIVRMACCGINPPGGERLR